MRLRVLLAVFIFPVALFSCSFSKKIDLPETPLLTRSPGWVIITAKWVRLKDLPSADSKDIGFLRYKDIGALKKTTYSVEESAKWCQILYINPETKAEYLGWVREQELLVLPTYEQAVSALKELR